MAEKVSRQGRFEHATTRMRNAAAISIGALLLCIMQPSPLTTTHGQVRPVESQPAGTLNAANSPNRPVGSVTPRPASSSRSGLRTDKVQARPVTPLTPGNVPNLIPVVLPAEPATAQCVADPNDSRTWQGASISTFAQLFYGSDTQENRQRIVDACLLVDGTFDITAPGFRTGVYQPQFSNPGGGTSGRSTLGGGYGYTTPSPLGYEGAANFVDWNWAQDIGDGGTSGRVWDLGGPANQTVVFPIIDHGPLPQESIEYSVYLSNNGAATTIGPDGATQWVPAEIVRVYLEGWTSTEIADGFTTVWKLPGGSTFRYTLVVAGGPAALHRDGDDEIDAVAGLDIHGNPIASDLVVTFVDTSGITGDWQALAISGTVTATIKNVGAAVVTQPFDVAFFEDYTFDGKFDPGSDNILGTATVNALAAGASTTVTADVRGSVLFRDNLIYAFVDSGNVIAESNEENNVANSGITCNARGGTVDSNITFDDYLVSGSFAFAPADRYRNQGIVFARDIPIENVKNAEPSWYAAAFAPTGGSGTNGISLSETFDPRLELEARFVLPGTDTPWSADFVQLDAFDSNVGTNNGSLEAFDQNGLLIERAAAITPDSQHSAYSTHRHGIAKIRLTQDADGGVFDNLRFSVSLSNIERTYTSSNDFQEGTLINVNLNTPDHLQLNPLALATFPFVNVAATARGTVVRIDANSGQIVGEFYSAPQTFTRDPSRTTVDRAGNVWCGDRGNGSNSPNWVVKIGLALGGTRGDKNSDGTFSPNPAGQYLAPPLAYNTCADRDGDGLIKTSTGLGNILPWPDVTDGTGGGPDVGSALVEDAQDECILLFQRLPGTAPTRHVSVDTDSNVWVGGWRAANTPTTFWKLDGQTGRSITSFNTANICGAGQTSGGYGGMIDSHNVLWSASSDSSTTVLRYDVDSGSAVCLNSPHSYGLTLDRDGNVWNARYANNLVRKFTPLGVVLGDFSIGSGANGARGLAASPNDGHIWVVGSLSNTVSRLDANGQWLKTLSTDGTDPTGAAVDSNGKIWVTNNGTGTVKRIDPHGGADGLGAIDLTVTVDSTSTPPRLYNYSDMTGTVLAAANGPEGTWTVVNDGGSDGTVWGALSWNSSEPTGTRITVEARAANERAALSGLPFVSTLNGQPFGTSGVVGRFIEIRVTFKRDPSADPNVTPILYDLTIHGPPDLSASFLRFSCDTPMHYVTARIGNGGAVNVDAGVPVSFYDGDPSAGGPLLGASHTSFPMAPGLFEDVTLQLPSGFDCTHETYVVADDLPSSRGVGYSAEIIASSDFTNGLDGWVSGLGISDIFWETTGGNPGAFLRFTQAPNPGPGNTIAPQKFLGDWSALDEKGLLDFDQRLIDPGTCINNIIPHFVEVSGPGGIAHWTGPLPTAAPTQWENYVIPISAEAWSITSGSWSALLHQVTKLSIRVELFGNTCSPDVSGIDNVRLIKRTLETGQVIECNETNNIHHAHVAAVLDRLVDVSTSIETQWVSTTYNRTNKTLVVEAKATNIGDITLRGPILMVIDDIKDAGVSVHNPDGYTSDGKPYFVFSTPADSTALFSKNDEIGKHSIQFDDALGPQPHFVFSWRAGTDEAPFFVSVPTTDGVITKPYKYQAQAIDPNGDTVHFAIVAGPDGLSIERDSGLVTWTPTTDDTGSHNVVITASDGFGGTATQKFAINVLAEIPNRPPVFTSAPVMRAPTGGTYEYQATAIDPDGDPVAFELTEGPTGMQIDPQNPGRVVWDFALPGTQGCNDDKCMVSVTAFDRPAGDPARCETVQTFVVTVGGEVATNAGSPSIFGTPGVIAAVGQQYIYQPTVSSPSGDAITCTLPQFPTGMSVDASTCRITWTPPASQLGDQPVTLKASDTHDGAALQLWKIKVLAQLPNRPPVILSVPGLIAEIGKVYTYQVIANDPDGQTPHYALVASVNSPSGMIIDADSGLLTWTPTAADANNNPFTVAIKVTDTATPPAYGSQVYNLVALPPNVPPVITSTPPLNPPCPDVSCAVVGGIYRYQVTATDGNPEDALHYSLIVAPDGMTINDLSGLITWAPQQAQLGPNNVVVAVRDGRAPPVEQAFTVTVTTDTLPPIVQIVLVQGTVVVFGTGGAPGECDAAQPTESPEGAIVVNFPATFCVQASDNVVVVNRTMAVDDVPLPLDNSGCAQITPSNLKTLKLTATATDAAGNVGNAPERHQPVGPGTPGTTPLIKLLSPAPEAVITSPQAIHVSITADDPSTLDRYCVQVAPADSKEFKHIGDGQLSGSNFEGDVAIFDPTKLPNDAYIVQVRVYTQDGDFNGIEFALNVSTEYKPGRFTTTFTDLTVPVGGIPLTVSRIYDSFDPRSGDFGPGWRLGLPGRVVDTAAGNGLISGSHIYVTRPDGKREGFQVFALPTSFLFPFIASVLFLPEAGVTDTLDIPGGLGTYFLAGGVIYEGLGTDPFNPSTYVLTTRQGVKYTIDELDGLRRIEDLNNNYVTVKPNGIFSSRGPGITFDRDAKGRITKVIEPDDDPTDNVAPRSLRYEYDSVSDNLIAVYDQNNNKTQFNYGQPGYPHYLTEVVDPLNRRGILNAYNDDGRLIAQCDSSANVNPGPLPDPCDDANVLPQGCIKFCNKLGDRQEVITDRLGFATVLTYDERGNVIDREDSYGNHTTYTFDANNRLAKEEDCAGRVKEYTYNANGDILTETNCSGGVTTYTRNNRGQPLTRTDALGNVTTYVYDDANGNLMQEMAADGGITTHTYDNGQTKSTTNPRGDTEHFDYDPNTGYMTAHTDFAGARTEYTYNASGDRVTETKLRRLSDGTTERITTQFFYDSDHREIKTIDTYLNTVLKDYDAAGQLIHTTDQLNHITTNIYHPQLGYLMDVDYSDGTKESYNYDAEGRRTSLTNRDRQETRYEFDRLGRLVKTFQPDDTPGYPDDNPFTQVTYDCVGRIQDQFEERGNKTHYDYDCDPNTQTVTDALNHITEHEFDLLGNRVKMTDALHHTTLYVYDSLGRQIQIIYHDGTISETRYDLAGSKERDIDQDHRITRYEHDPMSRLTSVTLSNNGVDLVTSYTYDDLGNQITQKDAESRVTQFDYDRLSRRVHRTLPLGQSETMEYDAAGRVSSKTDFNDHKIIYGYDAVGRETRETTPDGGYYEFAYNGVGKRTLERIVNPGQVAKDTVKRYDVRGRLTRVDNPDGSSLQYEYDAAGNRTLLVATTPQESTTTAYDFDVLNRLQFVHHPDNGGISTYTYDDVGNRHSLTLPNSTVATYEYDNLNRLTVLTNARSDQSIISRYAYTLSKAGQRSRVDETTPQGNARVVEYSYDDVYRLTGEKIIDLENSDLDISYVYDKVGNRKAKVLVGPGGTSTVVYGYDDNDRLLNEAETVKVAGAEDRQRQYYASNGILAPTKGTYYTSRSLLIAIAAGLLFPVVLLLPRRRGFGRRACRRRVITDTICLVLLPAMLLDGQSSQMLYYSGLAYAADGDVTAAAAATTNTAYSYDDNGNTLSRSTNSVSDVYSWDFRNRLVAAQNRTQDQSDTTFAYDVDGIRVGKGVAGQSTNQFLADKNRDHAQVVVETSAPISASVQSVTYVSGDDLLSMKRPESGVAYYHLDGQMSTRQITSPVSSVAASYTYDAFGVGLTESGSIVNEYRFAAQQTDANLGFQYLRSRYLDNAIGRFISADVFEGNASQPVTLHRYLYANVNPLLYKDMSGHDALISYGMLLGFGCSLLILLLTQALVPIVTSQLVSLGLPDGVAREIAVFVIAALASLPCAYVLNVAFQFSLAVVFAVGLLAVAADLFSQTPLGSACRDAVTSFVVPRCNSLFPAPLARVGRFLCSLVATLAIRFCNPFRGFKT